MTEPFFFEIPIYRCTSKDHSSLMEKERDKAADPEIKDIAPESYKNAKDYFDRHLWYGWRYNEIIGSLNLYIMGSQFRADYWLVKKQRFNSGITKKNFAYAGKAFEKSIPRNLTSAEIYKFILETLEHVSQSKEFKRFHFDLTTFKVMGEFVDWALLTEKLNSFAFPERRRKYFEDFGS